MKTFLTSLRLAVVTMAACVVGYTGVILGFAQFVTPRTADGSLMVKNGKVIGSELIAQKFSRPGYFWPRPVAGSGSNLSPTNLELTKRAEQLIAQYGATGNKPLPAELATSSGSGLDPDITTHAALYQAERVAEARRLSVAAVAALIRRETTDAGLVNVLRLNVALDELR